MVHVGQMHVNHFFHEAGTCITFSRGTVAASLCEDFDDLNVLNETFHIPHLMQVKQAISRACSFPVFSLHLWWLDTKTTMGRVLYVTIWCFFCGAK